MSKQNKQRPCPALGRTIASAECGADRHRLIACTADCAYNPFSPTHYDDLLERETDLDRRTLMALTASIGRDRVMSLLTGGKSEIDEHAGNAAIIREVFLRRDAQGQTFAERWLASSPRELNNDARVLLEAKTRMRPVLLEIREIRCDGLFHAVDLLEPEAGERLVLDRMTWGRCTRFQCLFLWSYPLPHFHRTFGAGIAWPYWPGTPVTPVEALHEIVTHLGGPAPTAPVAERRAWLAEHFDEVKNSLFAVSDARRIAMFEQLDATLGWREFALSKKASQDLGRSLEASSDVFSDAPDDDDRAAGMKEAWNWCEPASQVDAPGHRRLLGRVGRNGTAWRLRALSRDRLERLQTSFLALAGAPDLAPVREFKQDIGQQETLRLTEPDPRLVPPKLLEHPVEWDFSTSIAVDPGLAQSGSTPDPGEVAADFLAAADARWLDEPLPALDGRTPREAVRDRAGRTRLINLMKVRISEYDADVLRGRPRPDPMPLVHELGLDEIDLPLPPPRPLLEEDDEDDVDDADDSTDDDMRLPEPATAPLTPNELVDRLLHVRRLMPPRDILDVWDEEFPVLSDAVGDSIGNRLSAEEADFAVDAIALAWFALGGMETPRAHRFDVAKLRLAFTDLRSQLESLREVDAIMTRLETLCAGQPLVIRAIFAFCQQPEEVRTRWSFAGLVTTFAWIDTLTAELSRIFGKR